MDAVKILKKSLIPMEKRKCLNEDGAQGEQICF
jgi:hypothetical protein